MGDGPDTGDWDTAGAATHRAGVTERLRLLEPLACLALAGHAAAVQVVSSHGPTAAFTWAGVLVAALGVVGLLGWRATSAEIIRAGVLLVVTFLLLAGRAEGSGYVLLWYFVLVSVYPLVLPQVASRALVVAVPTTYLLLVPLDAADGPFPVALLRAVALALIGVFVHWAATAYREAVTDRDGALALLDTFVDATPVGLGFWDTGLRYRRLNAAMAQLSGLPVQAHLGRQIADVGHLSGALDVNLRRVLESGEPVREVELVAGGRVWSAACFPVRIGPRLLGVGAVAADVTDQRLAAEALTHSATHDALTGLPNRTLFTDRLDVALAQARRSDTDVAVLFCDLDRFKVINDSLGHAVGDEVLRVVGERLTSVVRAGDTVARLGGDEFAVLCTEVHDLAEVTAVADRARAAVRAPIVLGERTVTSTLSIGVRLCDPGEHDGADALRDADVAMYEAKRAGRDAVAVFDAEMRRGADERLDLHSDLRRAVDEQQVTLAYQPLLEFVPDPDGVGRAVVVGFEALARWDRPGRGPVGPSLFVPVAEDLGLIQRLGEQVLREACVAVREWQTATGLPLFVAVNLSARQVEAPGFVPLVASVLAELDVPASSLVMEITESVLMQDMDASRRCLTGLRALGVRLAMDDFGTGYSSLAYLHDLPLDTIKIDRAFTSRLPDDEALFLFMRDLARALGVRTVVEGVETAAQLATVQALGFDIAQGFHLSKPLPSGAVLDYLRSADLVGVEDRPAL